MRRIITGLPANLLIVFFLVFFVSIKANAQSDSQRVMIPGPVPQNAGFDVIVKLNGDLVYGLVKEVGPLFITYQRTDIPDGPIYSIPRNEVYVISYRNQVKDYINGEAGNIPGISQQYPNAPRYINYKNKNLFKNSNLTVGLGFLRSFSKVENVKNYSTSSSFPVLSFSYEVLYQKNIQIGVELGFGTHKFSNQQFSSYDSTNNNISLKENIFGLYVYGRYFLTSSSSRLQPYILAGLGITSSNIISENKISFTNDNTQVILVKSGSRATGLGITARVGAEYYLNDQLQLFLDAGVGLSVIKAGISININNEKH